MLIGVDLDNTIVCYDRLFHRLAAERGWIPRELDTNKSSVRDYLRSQGREEDWTQLQGIAYGNRINEAGAFPGSLEFFAECRRRDQPICIISHRTRQPYRGPEFDLHQAARGWLQSHQFVGGSVAGLTENQVFLEETKVAKLARIASTGCTHFVDDLPEFLLEDRFPGGVSRVLFDPADRYSAVAGLLRFTSWRDLQGHFFPKEEG